MQMAQSGSLGSSEARRVCAAYAYQSRGLRCGKK